MFEILKNMLRRKVRTSLTVFGITIGIFALVVMGALAEKLNLLVEGGSKYYSDKVTVSDANDRGFLSSPMSKSKIEDLEKVPGVAVASGAITTTLSKELSSVNFGPPPLLSATDLRGVDLESYVVRISRGRDLAVGDRKKAVVGFDLVKKLNAKVGENIKVRDREFEVIGIYEKTFTIPDTTVVIPLEDAQEIYLEEFPAVVKSQLKASEIINGITVYPKKGVDPDLLAKTINSKVEGVKASGPKQFEEQIANSVGIFSSIIFGIALISLLVGSLSIINTMTMSISERTKEIGVKKALGAKNKNILFEYLTEAGFIGLFGGLLGVGLGALVVNLINSILEKTGDKIFLLTNNLIIGSLIFSVALGIIAGIFPAVHAMRLNIVKSLREE